MRIPVSHKSCHTKGCLGAVQAVLRRSWSPGCRIHHLHILLVAVGTTDTGCEAHERPLLGLSEKQCCDNEGSKQAGYSQVNYTSHEHTQNTLQQVTYQQVIRAAEVHLNLVTKEKSLYRMLCKESKENPFRLGYHHSSLVSHP